MQHINLRIIKLRRFHQHIYTFAQTLTVNLAIILSSKFDYPTTVFLPKNPALPVIRFHACEEGGDYLKFNVQRITSCLLLQPVLLCTNSVNQTNYIEKLRSSQAINNLRLLQITVLDYVRTVSVPAVYRFVQHYS